MASAIGISRQTYCAIETRGKKCHRHFFALIAILDLDKTTLVMLDQIPNFIQAIRELTENPQTN